MTQETPFKFHVPVEVIEKSDSNGVTHRVIGGICSTDDLDSQSERLLQSGLDFSPFLNKGWFNDNHDSATGGAVGLPTKAELRDLGKGRQGWYVEGNLLDNKRANDIFDLANALERSETGRKLGFSVEGAIVERDPKDPSTVRKAVVREVAITRCPVNVNTELSLLAKSLTEQTKKALSAGHAPAVAGVAVPGSAAPLRVESLEGGAHPKKKKKKKLSKSQAVGLLMHLNPKVSVRSAEAIVNHAMRHYPVAQLENQNG